MSEAVILSACRTPIGKFRGSLSSVPATELGACVVHEAVVRAGVSPADVEEVIFGMVLPAGAGQAPARQAAFKAGLPATAGALTINKVCGSGMKAVMLADQAIRARDADVIVAGGMENMSQAPWLLQRDGPPIGERTLIDSMMNDGLQCAFSGQSMGIIADNLAVRAGISRAAQDQYAAESHRRAVAAMNAGAFQAELVAVSVTSRGHVTNVTADESPRADCDLARLSMLRPAFASVGSVTAGNASTISDGASAVVVASDEVAERLGRKPLARIVASATAGGPPEDLFTAPVAAIRRVLERAGRSLVDVDLFEINEAFAVQMLACIRQLDLPTDRVNVHGGAIALGHPIGASGARVLTTLLCALEQRQLRTGIAALCLGGGNAVAVLVERV
ncbi:MAG: acetyl-CoA C-acyltransferase [Planctomycetes bacterium]|nr:acetyl-CoA C-acyltransferase [Planctomycetota bacterium]